MRLTEKEAIEISIEKWEYLAETGGEGYPDDEKYGKMSCDCALCEYDDHSVCHRCPYSKKFGYCCASDKPFVLWDRAKTKKDRKKYASQFLEQLRSLK